MFAAPEIADRPALLRSRARAARRPALFLHEEAAAEVKERLGEVNKAFTAPLLVGHATPPLTETFPNAPRIADGPLLAIDIGAYDLVLHLFGLHWSNDPVGQLVQSRLALVPDGLFLAVLFGGGTLSELRTALAEAEIRVAGGISPRVAPMADLRELGGLLQRAGFALSVADSRRFRVLYPDLAALVRDLRGMGETNALTARHRQAPPRKLFREAEAIYRENFSEGDYLVATFEMVFLTGWAPSPTQQRPLKPGSAQARLADALGVPEHDTSDPPER